MHACSDRAYYYQLFLIDQFIIFFFSTRWIETRKN